MQRVIRQDGPALLFERVKGADFPLVMNLFGSSRPSIGLGDTPKRSAGNSSTWCSNSTRRPLEALGHARPPGARALHAAGAVSSAPVQEVVEAPRLDRLPNLWSWPRDGGPSSPSARRSPRSRTHARNFGLYRLQVFDHDHRHALAEHEGWTGHHFEAERLGQPLEAAVVLGGDPSRC